jgi:hypothetical protein
MIGLGSVLILWAMAFAIAVQSSRGGEDKTDAGVNFCTSLVILMVVMALVAPLALTGAGIKCLAERKEDPGWCVFAEDNTDDGSMLSAGVLMVVLGVIAFFIEWCVLFHCRPREPLEINEPPPTPPLHEECPPTPPYYENEPPRPMGQPAPAAKKGHLGPYLARSKWWNGPIAGGGNDSSAGHTRVAGYNGVPVALSGVEAALRSPKRIAAQSPGPGPAYAADYNNQAARYGNNNSAAAAAMVAQQQERANQDLNAVAKKLAYNRN